MAINYNNNDVTTSGVLTANSGLFTSGINVASQTASTIASFDANKNMASLATVTYPSLTELSYVKGVTSAIQTQIDSKSSTGVTITAGSGLTGGGSLSANRTIDVGQGDGISVTADAIAVDSTVVRTTGTQTINGAKTFGSASIFVSGLTSSGNILISNQTASTIASFDASKNVTSLATATYPSLTELSYVKGVTSAIQTQIDSKSAASTTITAGSGLTGGGSLAANRTIDVGQGDGISVTADAIAVDSTVVRTTGTQTVNGAKTFGDASIFVSGLTSSGNILISNQTASTIASFDASKNVSSLSTATYPSLTELSYVKGVTSAIQTQLGNKAETSVTITAGSGLTGGGTLAASRTIDIGQGDGIAVAADSIAVDSTVVRTTGTQTINGAKTFGSASVFVSGLTSSGNILISNQTASTIAGFDASKNITSLSTTTYPSLTELSYVKGVTSAIQTQLNGKQATLTNPVTGTGTTSYIPRWSSSSALTNSIIYDNGSSVGINTASPAAQLHVVGSGLFASGAVVSGTLTSQILTATTGVITNYAGTIDVPAGGRLTLTSADPFPSGDVTNASTLYYTPYVSNRIALYDTTNTRWQLHTFSEVSFTLTALSSGVNYDVFLYDNAGTKTMQAVAWTNNTTRATGLATQDGVYVQTGSAGRRYIGTFRTVSTTGTSDSATNRFVWNMNNRETEILFTNPGYNDNNADTTYTLAGATVTALNGGTGAKTEMVCGLRTVVEAQVRLCGSTTSAGGLTVGIGVDQTGNIDWGVNIRTSEFTRGLSSKRDYILDAGYHHFNLLGINTASTTNTINADYARNFAGTKDLIGTSMSQNYLG